MALHAKRYMPVIEGPVVRAQRLAAGMSLRAAAAALGREIEQEIDHKQYQRKIESDGEHTVEPDVLYALQKIFGGRQSQNRAGLKIPRK